jgi:hypothetical protein
MEPGMTLPDIPAAVAVVTAIFGAGAGVIIGWALPIRTPKPPTEPTNETIEQRRRMNDA